MNYRIKTKKLGNRWYLDVDHISPSSIAFNDKICKVFNLCDTYNYGELTISLMEEYSLVYNNNIFINDADLLKYFTTDDHFDIRFMVKDHEFSISSDMYNLLELQFNPNFHKTYYRLEIFNWTI